MHAVIVANLDQCSFSASQGSRLSSSPCRPIYFTRSCIEHFEHTPSPSRRNQVAASTQAKVSSTLNGMQRSGFLGLLTRKVDSSSDQTIPILYRYLPTLQSLRVQRTIYRLSTAATSQSSILQCQSFGNVEIDQSDSQFADIARSPLLHRSADTHFGLAGLAGRTAMVDAG